ncbi:MAG: hypothetical protein J0L75_19680 [Spirochaetes bacterium]|nr:hypothetical protein [Spirochaetota bacterium]
MKRPARFLRGAVAAFLLGAPAWLGALEVFNFPDLVTDLKPLEIGDSNRKFTPRPWGIETNWDWFDLGQAPKAQTELGNALLDLRLRQYLKDPDRAFLWDYFRFDAYKRQLFYQIQSAPEVKKRADQPAGGLAFSMESIETTMRLYGNQTLNLKWGTAGYLKYLDPGASAAPRYKYSYLYPTFEKGALGPPVRPFASDNLPFTGERLVADGFTADQNLVISLQGTIARKVEVEVDYDARSRRNNYRVEYKGDPNELITSVRLGDVGVNLGGKSQFVTGGGSQKDAFGLEMKASRKNFNMSASLSFTKGVSVREDFNIGEAVQRKDITYAANRFYQLPDRSIKDAFFFVSVSGTSTNTADAVFTFLDPQGTASRVYFQRLDGSRWRMDSTAGIFDCMGQKPGSPYYSVLFYSRSNNLPASSSNWARQMSNLIFTPLTFSTNLPVFQNFALIDFPLVTAADLGDSLELRNHYEIDSGFDISSFRMKILSASGDLIDPVVWIGTYNTRFQYYGNAEVFPDRGYLRFEDRRALTNRPAWYAGMYDALTPLEANSQIRFSLSYRAPAQNYISLGHPNILPNSVVVVRNGRLMADSEYNVNLYSGRITFNATTPLLLGDKVEVFYEYQPFGSSLQRVLVGGRADYTFREGSYIGSSVAYSSGQTSLTAPRVGSETTAQFVADVDTQLDLVALLARKRNNDWSVNVSGEYAFSLFDRNVRGVAVFNNMEPEDTEYAFNAAKNFQNYYFTANPRLDGAENRRLGKSYFVDFNLYNLSGTRTAVPFDLVDEMGMRSNTADGVVNHRQDVNFRPFEVRPGPFQVYGEGQLDRAQFPEQSSLVFDYDFSPVRSNGGTSLGYLSFVAPTTYFGAYGNRGIDFTRFRRMEIIYKLIPSVDEGGLVGDETNVLGFSIDVGQPTEDLDRTGTGPLRETSPNDPLGFPFSYNLGTTPIQTRIGGGWRGWRSPATVDEGNGRMDTADFNGDTLLNTNEIMTTFPGAATTGGATNFFLLWNSSKVLDAQEQALTNIAGLQYQRLSNTTGGTDPLQKESFWKVSMPLQSLAGTNVLSAARFFRVNLLETSNTRPRGRLVIDSITFKGSSWNATRVDGFILPATPQLSVYTINTLQDDYYRRNHVARAFRNVYEDLNGSLLTSEYDRLSESALSLEYNLNGVPSSGLAGSTDGRMAWVETLLPSGAVDLSAYYQMRFFVFAREQSVDGAERLVYRFGKNEQNYYELSIPARIISNYTGGTSETLWHEFSIIFRGKTPDEEASTRSKRGSNQFLLAHRSSKVIGRGNRNTETPLPMALSDYAITKKGSPTLFEVAYTAVGVVNPDSAPRRGNLWVNDIYMAEDQVQFGQSYRFGVAVGKKTPVRVRETEILSGLSAGLQVSHNGLNFSSLDLAGNQTQRESVSINAGMNVLRSLSFGYEMLKNYYVSQWDDALMPKENQGVGDTAVTRYNLGLKFPAPLGRFTPDINHSVSRSTSRAVRFVPVDSTGSNVSIDPATAKLRVENQENVIKSYSLGESKTWAITPKVSVGQSYKIGADFTRTLTLATNLLRSDLSVWNESGSPWYPVEALFGLPAAARSPVYQYFPDSFQSIVKKKDYLSQADYQFRRSQELTFDLALYEIRLNFGTSWGESTYFSLTNSSNANLEEIQRLFEPETLYTNWYETWWPEIRSLWQDHQIKDLSLMTGVDRSYNASLSVAQPLLKGPVPILGGGFSLSGSWSHAESDFRKAPRSFVAADYLAGSLASIPLEKRAQFTSYAVQVQDWFTNLVTTRDLRDDFTLNLRIPFAFGDKFLIQGLPISFTRRVSLTANDQLYENPGTIPLWQSLNRDFPGSTGSFSDGDSQPAAVQRAVPLLFGSLPWFDLAGPMDLYFLVRSLFESPDVVARARMEAFNQGRAARAATLDRVIQYVTRPVVADGASATTLLDAHRDYAESALQSDSWDLTLTLRRFPVIDYFLPDTFRFSGGLTTGKTTSQIQQNLSRNFSIDKKFDRFSRLLSSLFKSGKGFSRGVDLDANYTYKETEDYNLKTVVTAHNFRAGTTLRLFRELTMGFVYELGVSRNDQLLRWRYGDRSGSNRYADYLGIGDPAWVTVTNNGLEEVLNVGSNENWVQATTSGGLPLERSDLITWRHSLAVNFRWNEPKPLTIKLFKREFKLPQNTSQQIGLNLNWYQYEIPAVDVGALQAGNVAPIQQPNVQALKNLSNFTDPNRGEFSRWSLRTGYNSTLPFTQNFSLNWGVSLALVERMQAPSYVAYLGVDYEKLTASQKLNWDPTYMRQSDYIQLGVEISVGGSLRF